MCVTATRKRRHRQMRKGEPQLHPLRRPRVEKKKHDVVIKDRRK